MTTQHHINRRQRLFEKVMTRCEADDETGCLIWTGPTSGSGRGGGYGRVSVNGQTTAVHRVIYTHFYGLIPGNREVDHTCNNRLCCNPGHLKLVTRSKNERAKRARSGGAAK